MYDTNIIFHSNRQYPAIERSGSKPFSINGPTLIRLASGLSTDKRFIVFQELDGYRSIAGMQFINGGNLFVYIVSYGPKMEHCTGGLMPINLSDFIFHSSYVPSQRTGTNIVTVRTGTSVGANSTATWQSDWQRVGFPIPEIDFTVKVSGTVYDPTTANSTFRGPVTFW